MKLKDEIYNQIHEFRALCQSHSVKMLYAFGSSVTSTFNEQLSDIDLLVEIDDDDPIERGAKFMTLWDRLEEFFHRKVDLLTDSSIKNPILRKNIDATKILIYDGSGQKILV